jgi:hypothetical protein
MFTRTLLAAAVAVLMAGPALASECPKHMKSIDEALMKSPKLTEMQMSEVKKLRQMGEEQHKAGQHAQSMETLKKAEGMLGMMMK